MRTTVDIDSDLLQRLREEAHRIGIPVKELLNRAIRRGLGTPPPASEPYRCPTFELGPPLRPLDKALALADSLEDEEIARKLALRK